MPDSTFSVIIDGAIKAVKAPPVADQYLIKSVAYGATPAPGDDPQFWLDPTQSTLMLMPLQLKAEFSQSPATPARLRKTAFDLTSASWEEIERIFGGNYFLLSNKTDEQVTTKTTYPKNQGFWLSFYCFGSPGQAYQIVECEFGGSSSTDRYKLQIDSNGKCILYKGSERVGTGYLSNLTNNVVGRQVDLLILPYRRRQILFYSNIGPGWVHTDWTMSADYREAGYEITKADRFYFKFPS